ncbi:MAG: hypothetical protein IH963_04855 [Chloroflexi bacterium]|nr:hypothetical protein [Chloroflexota bacterium]
MSKETVLDRWLFAIEVAFRKHYLIPKANLSTKTLPFSAFNQYQGLRDIINGDLQTIITMRNKLAHGQWAFPLNREGTNIAQDQMDELRTENLFSMQFKKSLLKFLCEMVHDLVVSLPTFQRDFDKHYRQIEQTRRNLQTRKYDWYKNQLRRKYQEGRLKARFLKIK